MDSLLLQGNDLSREFLQLLKQNLCGFHAVVAVDGTHGLVIEYTNQSPVADLWAWEDGYPICPIVLSFRSLFLSLSNYDFGVIFSPLGQGSLSAKTEFVGQRHTLPISRVDTIEVSTLLGCLLRGVTSMYYSRLQSYGGISNNSLSITFTLFPFISLYFTGS